MEQVDLFKALSNKTRLQILDWLKEPEANFPGQKEYGYEQGVCVGQLQAKANLTQSTISEYLSILQRAGFVQATRKGQWTYYKRDEAAFERLSTLIANTL